jgi:hypothetical protein
VERRQGDGNAFSVRAEPKGFAVERRELSMRISERPSVDVFYI